MPVIRVSGPKADIESKRKLAEGFTKVASEAYNLPASAFVVLIDETPQENVATGGVLLVDRQHKP